MDSASVEYTEGQLRWEAVKREYKLALMRVFSSGEEGVGVKVEIREESQRRRELMRQLMDFRRPSVDDAVAVGFLADARLTVQAMEPDGNCLFRSLSRMNGRGVVEHGRLRVW